LSECYYYVSLSLKYSKIRSIISLVNGLNVLLSVCGGSLAAEFPKFLGVCMETFITLIDDADIDIKLVADECLNRVIRVSDRHFYFVLTVIIWLLLHVFAQFLTPG